MTQAILNKNKTCLFEKKLLWYVYKENVRRGNNAHCNLNIADLIW